MTLQELTTRVKALAREAGFDLVGIAPLDALPELEKLSEWLERGFAGEMNYLSDPRRRDPQSVLPGARSAIVVGLNYNTPQPYSTEVPLDPERGWVSRYAWGEDYHDAVREKLERLLAALRGEVQITFDAKVYVDTGPVLERALAKHAGLGWLAKNTCVLNAEIGSWFFLGVILTTLELAPDSPLPDQCGSCTLCIEACPTGAITAPYLLDSRRCISYLTIELRGPVPEEFREPMGRHVFGCDICPDVCPYNRPAEAGGCVPPSGIAAFAPREVQTQKARSENRDAPSPAAPAAGKESLFHPQLGWLAQLSEEDFRRIFQKSAIKRAKWRGLLRNVLVAIGNSGNPRFIPLLKEFAAGQDPLLAEHASWALKQLDA